MKDGNVDIAISMISGVINKENRDISMQHLTESQVTWLLEQYRRMFDTNGIIKVLNRLPFRLNQLQREQKLTNFIASYLDSLNQAKLVWEARALFQALNSRVSTIKWYCQTHNIESTDANPIPSVQQALIYTIDVCIKNFRFNAAKELMIELNKNERGSFVHLAWTIESFVKHGDMRTVIGFLDILQNQLGIQFNGFDDIRIEMKLKQATKYAQNRQNDLQQRAFTEALEILNTMAYNSQQNTDTIRPVAPSCNTISKFKRYLAKFGIRTDNDLKRLNALLRRYDLDVLCIT